MNKQYDVSEAETKKSHVPHEILITNLVFNYILIFMAVLSASSLRGRLENG